MALNPSGAIGHVGRYRSLIERQREAAAYESGTTTPMASRVLWLVIV